jgi:BolA protein
VTLRSAIETKLGEALHPVHLEVVNESSMHNVPPGSETHFKVLVVSADFEGLGLVDRHRKVNETLRAELANGVHALSIRALTPSQWSASNPEFTSPQCLGGLGGSKKAG